ncbi:MULTISPECIES: hypothetical protein [unclassified Serratia (in: enterobacteria)]|uniref:hypothetical protein n=1 Tax=unclassified Serratia (in: enterobacteria) TaxID=2647522 RepID=UPI003076786A
MLYPPGKTRLKTIENEYFKIEERLIIGHFSTILVFHPQLFYCKSAVAAFCYCDMRGRAKDGKTIMLLQYAQIHWVAG